MGEGASRGRKRAGGGEADANRQTREGTGVGQRDRQPEGLMRPPPPPQGRLFFSSWDSGSFLVHNPPARGLPSAPPPPVQMPWPWGKGAGVGCRVSPHPPPMWLLITE